MMIEDIQNQVFCNKEINSTKEIDFKNCQFKNIDFSDSEFQKVGFVDCHFESCDFSNTV